MPISTSAQRSIFIPLEPLIKINELERKLIPIQLAALFESENFIELYLYFVFENNSPTRSRVAAGIFSAIKFIICWC